MMAKTRPGNCPKFTLFLKARTSRKRLFEAKHALESLYPFYVDEKNILILKTDKKGHYDVYLLKEEIKSEQNIKKICLAIFPCILVLAGLIIAVRYVALKNSESLMAQKELEKHKQEEAKMQMEKEENLVLLEKEYDEKKSAGYEKIYPCLERIYSALEGKATIENISIQKNAFTVEVTAKDAVGILARFEESRAFTSVKMNRTTVQNGAETVIYSGEFSRFWTLADKESSLDDKIKFYEKELLKMEERAKAKRSASLSEYIKNIRETMHKNSCNEQYIQLKGKNDSAQIEFFVFSNSKSILNFIKEIQEKDENLIDIKNFTFRNSERCDRLSTTICFDTGIELKRNDTMLSEYVDKKITLSEIDKIFYKTPAVKVATIKAEVAGNSTPTLKANENTALPKMKTLSYIGRTKVKGKEFVIAKDDEMGNIYKLSLLQAETDGDFCVSTDGGYRAKIHGEYYEVKK